MIVITGLRRSGTSMMMLALKESGIPIIGKDMADEHNPNGYYELSIVTRGLKEKTYDMKPGMAIKVTADGFYFSDPTLISKVIVILRDPSKVIKSQLKVGICPKNHIKAVIEKNARDLERTFKVIKEFNLPKLEVDYEEILKYPKKNMQRVCKFLGQGNSDGYRIIDPKLNHYGVTR